MNYSRSLNSESKKSKIDPKEKAMADLMIMGWKDTDAFIAAGFYNPSYSDEYNKKQLENIVSNDHFIKYMDLRNKAFKRGINKQLQEESDNDEEVTLLSKEEVLLEAVKTAKLLPDNDPKRIDVLMKYADLLQMKKDEVKDEDSTIHFYLPLTCYKCQLYIENKKTTK